MWNYLSSHVIARRTRCKDEWPATPTDAREPSNSSDTLASALRVNTRDRYEINSPSEYLLVFDDETQPRVSRLVASRFSGSGVCHLVVREHTVLDDELHRVANIFHALWHAHRPVDAGVGDRPDEQ